MAVQLPVELNPRHACVHLDKKNWFNEAARHAALEFCATRPDELGSITPMLHAMHQYGSPLHYYDGIFDGTRSDDLVEGGKQGGFAASHLVALALKPVLQFADSKLKENGGCAPAISDDEYLLDRPPEAAVYPQYKVNLEKIGGSLNEVKTPQRRATWCYVRASLTP
jgi:hypothetical protein